MEGLARNKERETIEEIICLIFFFFLHVTTAGQNAMQFLPCETRS